MLNSTVIQMTVEAGYEENDDDETETDIEDDKKLPAKT